MPLAVESLLPHRAPMRWIDALTHCTDTTATATAVFDEHHFAVADGQVLETALIECMAQTIAAASGQRGQKNGTGARANIGMLAAVTNFSIQARPTFGQELQIEVRERRRLGPLTQVAGVISCAGQTIASGELTLFQTVEKL